VLATYFKIIKLHSAHSVFLRGSVRTVTVAVSSKLVQSEEALNRLRAHEVTYNKINWLNGL